ncbi:P-loop ATPase, Sll1717 family [Streptomyces arboris]|uniref:P-loop ATPase, Sll1717 family n=1 Tax=Streptomyces arboris TaxID=2600619 RepID=UPI003C2F4E0F
MQHPHRPVDRLFFGRDDAETDFSSGLLRPGFQRTHAYEAALTGRKSLVIGRKGSGKSAICALLADGSYAGETALITPDDAAGDEIRRFELQGLTADTAKSLIWRYIFAVQAARYLTTHARTDHGGLLMPAPVRALRDFLAANDESGDEKLTERLRRGARRLQSASLSLKAFGVEATASAEGAVADGASEGARAARQLDALEAGVRAAFATLDCAGRHHPLLILVDQLEQVWRLDSDSHALVTGLLLAAKYVTGHYQRAVRCVLFVRADIYDSLNFADGDKFRSDEVRITWTPAALRDLALTRARISLDRPLEHEDFWGSVFPATVRGEPTPDYLSRRSLARPRDAIQFLTLCRDTAEQRGHATVSEDDVLEATEQFSRWKLADLAKEYNVGFPFLRPVFALFENSGYLARRHELEERFERIREALLEAHPSYSEHLTHQAVVEALFGIGFLGVRRGDGVVHAGDSALPVQPYEDELHVHPCFRPALNCRNRRGRSAPGPAGDGASARPDHTDFLRNVTTTDASFSVNREVRLLDELVGSCERVMRQFSRSALPVDVEREMSGMVGATLEHARLRRDSPGPGPADIRDIRTQVGAGAALFRMLGRQVAQQGFADDPVCLRFDDEARVLNRVLGGAVGTGTGSDSSG